MPIDISPIDDEQRLFISSAIDDWTPMQDRLIDVGMLTLINHQNEKVARLFINIASFGIGGDVDDRVNRQTKVLGGKVSFLRGAVVATILYKILYLFLEI